MRAASITGMLQKLAGDRPSFVKHEKHRGVVLTELGKRRALEIQRHHRLLERFLHDFLDFSWDEVHGEAERLEHYISERLEDRIAAKLGDPETDPHGHIIPEKDGAAVEREEVALSKWPCGVPAGIRSVSDRDPQALREMKNASGVAGRADWRKRTFMSPPRACFRNQGYLMRVVALRTALSARLTGNVQTTHRWECRFEDLREVRPSRPTCPYMGRVSAPTSPDD